MKFDDSTIPARGTTANCRFMATDVFCGPKRLTGDADVLYRNNGDGTFTDVSTASGVIDPGYYGFGVVFTDLNDDGWPDIYVANDSVPNLLFRNRKDGTFVEEGLISGAALSGDGRPQAGMGVDAGDYNGDGLPDLIVTNFSHDHNTLYENGPAGVFSDRSYAAGIAATAGPYLGWGVKFVDVDNDGRLDVVMANGHVYPEVDRHGLGTRYHQRKQLFLNEGKRFRHATAEVGGGLLLEKSSRGAAFGDYDNDGDIDVARDQHERSADAAAQRHGARWSLDHASTRGHEEQPRCDRREGHRGGRWPATDDRGPRRWQLSVSQRSAGARRAGGGHDGESRRDSVAERSRPERRRAWRRISSTSLARVRVLFPAADGTEVERCSVPQGASRTTNPITTTGPHCDGDRGRGTLGSPR